MAGWLQARQEGGHRTPAVFLTPHGAREAARQRSVAAVGRQRPRNERGDAAGLKRLFLEAEVRTRGREGGSGAAAGTDSGSPAWPTGWGGRQGTTGQPEPPARGRHQPGPHPFFSSLFVQNLCPEPYCAQALRRPQCGQKRLPPGEGESPPGREADDKPAAHDMDVVTGASSKSRAGKGRPGGRAKRRTLRILVTRDNNSDVVIIGKWAFCKS